MQTAWALDDENYLSAVIFYLRAARIIGTRMRAMMKDHQKQGKIVQRIVPKEVKAGGGPRIEERTYVRVVQVEKLDSAAMIVPQGVQVIFSHLKTSSTKFTKYLWPVFVVRADETMNW